MSAMNHDYHRIAAAIKFISENQNQQPSLEEVAAHVHLSPYHFQRLFSEWAGVSPKKFLQYLTVEYAKRLLNDNHAPTLFDTAADLGLSGTGRLHDLFVRIEGMTPGEYKNKGAQLQISYSFSECQFGKYLVASTPRGICHLHFIEDEEKAINELAWNWRFANIQQNENHWHHEIARFFQGSMKTPDKITLHLAGTPFQLKVWQALLKIPEGRLSTYSQIAATIGHGSAQRAVGSAIGSNPIAFIIPCHRVIRSEGLYGHFRWGAHRKKAIIGWEAAHNTRSLTELP
jgi:AraC family transcriptional regulator of adaptative response/methylated-DNA-[protein]-cysteine methyltransferase